MRQFSQTLKTWRNARRFSQLSLAVHAEVSSRHISFLESGRAKPSREMVGKLSEALQLPLAIKNQMLVDAGFAPRYARKSWDDVEMAQIRSALSYTLAAHAPYPAIAIDRNWIVFQMNSPAEMLFGALGVSVGTGLIDLIMADRLSPFIENWPEVAKHTAQRLRTESAGQGGNALFDRAAAKLAQVDYTDRLDCKAVVPTIYRNGNLRLSLFGTIAQFGTAEDLALEDFKIELFFPADTETDQCLRQFSEQFTQREDHDTKTHR